MDMHMDGAWGTFWIKSQNGTFIALQMKSFGPKKFQISSTGKKVPFRQFFKMGWDGLALLGGPSRIPHRNWKIIFVLGANEYIERLEGKVIECLFFYFRFFKITVWRESYISNFSVFRRSRIHHIPLSFCLGCIQRTLYSQLDLQILFRG